MGTKTSTPSLPLEEKVLEDQKVIVDFFKLFLPLAICSSSDFSHMSTADRVDFTRLYVKAVSASCGETSAPLVAEGKRIVLAEITVLNEVKLTFFDPDEEFVDMVPDSKVAAALSIGAIQYPDGFTEAKKVRLGQQGYTPAGLFAFGFRWDNETQGSRPWTYKFLVSVRTGPMTTPTTSKGPM